MTTASTSGTCEAPCSPACDRPAAHLVMHQDRPLKVCGGHYKKHQRKLPLEVPLRSKDTPRMEVAFARVSPELRTRVEAAAEAEGSDFSTAVREGLELWLAARERKAKRGR